MKPDLDPNDLESIERQLFNSLSGDEPPKRAHRAAAAALGLGSATLTSATAGGASVGAKAGALFAAKSGTMLLVKWVGIGTLASAMSIGAVRYAQRPVAQAPHVAATARMPPPVVPGKAAASVAESTPIEANPPAAAPEPAPIAAPQRVAEPTVVTELRIPSSTMAARRPAAPVQAVPRVAPPDAPIEDTAALSRARPASTLAAEVASLDEVRRALTAKDGDRALAQLRRHTREFPSGTLNLEATVLHIEALFLAGSSDAAREMGRAFLAANPSSTHASRVRHLLAEHEKP